MLAKQLQLVGFDQAVVIVRECHPLSRATPCLRTHPEHNIGKNEFRRYHDRFVRLVGEDNVEWWEGMDHVAIRSGVKDDMSSVQRWRVVAAKVSV